MWMIIPLLQNFLNFLFPPKCYLCSKEGESLCEQCLLSLGRPLDSAHHFISSLYSFKDTRVKKVVHAIKFFHRKDLILPLSKKLLPLLPEDTSTWVLVPIPIHPLRRFERGYNQAELLAQALSKESGVTFNKNLLKKIKYTPRQVTAKSKSERLSRQKNSFRVSGQVSDKNIILIDDVTTTGTTLVEAKRCLIKSGAVHVLAITIAH